MNWHRFSDEDTRETSDVAVIEEGDCTLVKVWTNPPDALEKAGEKETALTCWLDEIIDGINPELPWILRLYLPNGEIEQTLYLPHNETD